MPLFTYGALLMHGAKYRIWVQLLLTIAAALVLVWSGVVVWQGYAYREAAND